MMVGSKFEKRCYQFFDFTTLDSSMMFSYRNRIKALIRIILTLNHHKYKKFLQKQPSRGAPRERCSESVQPICWGGQGAHTRKKFTGEHHPHGIFAAGGATVPTQEKKKKKIYGRTPMPKCDFNKVALQLTLRYGCTPVNLVHIFRTPFPTNTLEGCFWS